MGPPTPPYLLDKQSNKLNLRRRKAVLMFLVFLQNQIFSKHMLAEVLWTTLQLSSTQFLIIYHRTNRYNWYATRERTDGNPTINHKAELSPIVVAALVPHLLTTWTALKQGTPWNKALGRQTPARKVQNVWWTAAGGTKPFCIWRGGEPRSKKYCLYRKLVESNRTILL